MISKTALAFLLIFCSCCVATLIRSPLWGIVLYELQYFVNPPNRWWWGELPITRFSLIAVVFIFVGFVYRRHQFRQNRLWEAPQVRWIMGISFLVLLTSFWAVDPEVHLEVVTRYLKILVFAILAYKILSTPKDFEILFATYLFGAFYISWIGWQVGRTGDGRLEGIGTVDTIDSNGAAAIIVTAVPLFIFYLLFGKRKLVQICSGIGLAFALNGLILLNSRGAFLGLIASCLYLCLYIFKDSGARTVKIRMLAGLAIGVGLFLYLADNVFWERMSSLRNVDPESGSGHRIQLWMKTFEMMKDHPWGMGGRGYALLSPRYLPPEWLSGGERVVHSTWFEVLSEYGYQGLIAFIGYIASCFISMRKLRMRLRQIPDEYHLIQSVGLESSLIGLLVAGSFINFFYGELLYWLPMYMAAFANAHSCKERFVIKGTGVA